MSTALLDYGTSYNFIVLPQLKQFATNSKDLQWAKPLQVKLAKKSNFISLHFTTLFVQFLPGTTPVAVEFLVVL